MERQFLIDVVRMCDFYMLLNKMRYFFPFSENFIVV